MTQATEELLKNEEGSQAVASGPVQICSPVAEPETPSAKALAATSLFSFIVRVRPQKECTSYPFTGPTIHGIVLHVLSEFDSALSRRLHDEKIKSFTVSPLHGPIEQDVKHGCAFLLRGRPYWFRVTALSATVADGMARALKSYANARSPIRYNNGSLEIDSVVMSVEHPTSLSCSTLGHPCPAEESESDAQNSTPEALKWLRSESYASLIRRSLPSSSATFEFLSPTAFRQLDHLYLFPEPATIFRGLLSRWNALAPVSLPDTLVQAARDKIYVTRFNLRTVPVGMAKLTAVGFLGECTFDLSACSTEEKREFSALARFAFYSGVGLKTAMGLGQCLVK